MYVVCTYCRFVALILICSIYIYVTEYIYMVPHAVTIVVFLDLSLPEGNKVLFIPAYSTITYLV